MRSLFVSIALVLLLPAAALAQGDFVFVTTTDFTTGSSAVIDLPAKTVSTYVTAVHSDATARFYGGLIYVVNRLGGDNIQVLDPGLGFSTVRQFSVGNGSDPHDIAVLSPSVAYVPRYEGNDVWKVNPTTGAHTGTIDLSSLADADGFAEVDQLLLVGDLLFVSVQRLDRDNFYGPVGTSYLAVIDTSTDTLVDVDAVAAGTQSILLTGTNPFSEIQLDGHGARLYVSTVGFFGVADGGVEVVDPVTFQPGGFIFTETAAGGDILDVEIVSPTRGFAIISTPSFDTELVAFDPSTGTRSGTVFAPGGYVLQDIDVSPSSGELFLADRTPTHPGIRCFDSATGDQITAGPIDTGLPPFDITFSDPVQTAAADAPFASVLGANYPNPFNPSTTIPFTLSQPGQVTLSIHDAAGRRVATLADGPMPAGASTATWDGRNARGARVSSGVYFARLETRDGVFVRKIAMLK